MRRVSRSPRLYVFIALLRRWDSFFCGLPKLERLGRLYGGRIGLVVYRPIPYVTIKILTLSVDLSIYHILCINSARWSNEKMKTINKRNYKISLTIYIYTCTYVG